MVKKEEIRKQIILAASEIFSKYGFKKTTMDEIAHSIRKGKSSIYYYFTSKEEIFEAVVKYEADTLNKTLAKAAFKTDDPQENLKNYILTRMRTLKKVGNYYQAIKSEYLSHLDFIEKIRERYDKQEIRTIQKILQEGVDSKKFRVEDTELAAIAIVTAMKGLEIPLFWSDGKRDLERRLDQLLNVLFYGIINQ